MSKKTTKSVEPNYVTRTVSLPLSESEMNARQKDLPLVISAEARSAALSTLGYMAQIGGW